MLAVEASSCAAVSTCPDCRAAGACTVCEAGFPRDSAGLCLASSLARVATERIVVFEDRRELRFSFEDMLNYHGGGSPGGVAHAFKVLERALPSLDPAAPAQRQEIFIETAFGGPGARDGFELVTRAVTQGRFSVDSSLVRPDHGRARERFVFRLRYRGRAVTLTLREGFVTTEFIALTRREWRSVDEERELTMMKSEMAERVMSAAPEAVYDITCGDPPGNP